MLGGRPLIDTGLRMTGWSNIFLGSKFRIMRQGALHAHQGYLRIGNNVSINSNVCIAPCDGGHVAIGNNVLIGQNVVIRAADHGHDDVGRPMIEQGHVGGKILIEDDVWIGANCVITTNVVIGQHSIVGAGSVVTHDVPPYCIVAGVPARIVRQRNLKDEHK